MLLLNYKRGVKHFLFVCFVLFVTPNNMTKEEKSPYNARARKFKKFNLQHMRRYIYI